MRCYHHNATCFTPVAERACAARADEPQIPSKTCSTRLSAPLALSPRLDVLALTVESRLCLALTTFPFLLQCIIYTNDRRGDDDG
jgi:hypothetical protein